VEAQLQQVASTMINQSLVPEECRGHLSFLKVSLQTVSWLLMFYHLNYRLRIELKPSGEHSQIEWVLQEKRIQLF
jgi:hypothetical protein